MNGVSSITVVHAPTGIDFEFVSEDEFALLLVLFGEHYGERRLLREFAVRNCERTINEIYERGKGVFGDIIGYCWLINALEDRTAFVMEYAE